WIRDARGICLRSQVLGEPKGELKVSRRPRTPLGNEPAQPLAQIQTNRLNTVLPNPCNCRAEPFSIVCRYPLDRSVKMLERTLEVLGVEREQPLGTQCAEQLELDLVDQGTPSERIERIDG